MIKIYILFVLHLFTGIIFAQTNIDDRKIEFRDGIEWQYYINNGLKIAMTNSTVKEYGKWHKIDLMIFNNSNDVIELDPVNQLSALSTNNENVTTELEVWSSDKYLKKVRRIQNWAMALNSFSEGLNAGNAGYSNTSSLSTNNGYTYSTTYNHNAAFQAQMEAQNRIANLSEKMKDELKIKQLGYLKRNTIYPGESIQGYIYIKYIKGKTLYIIFRQSDQIYKFDWNIEKKQK